MTTLRAGTAPALLLVLPRVASLAPSGRYLVYARTRDASAPLADRLVGLGLARVVDAGAVGALVVAGGAGGRRRGGPTMRRCTVGGMRQSLAVTAAAVVAPLLLALGACSSDESAVRTVDADRAVELIRAEESPVVIDVRTPAEFAAGHVADALNIDVTSRSFPDDLAELDKDQTYLVYCQTGNRSETAVAKMRELGFSDLVDAGGVASLQDAGAEIVAER